VNVAEFSILVADAYQGQGIGSKLLREVIAHAKSEGIDAIEAVVLPSNQSMVHVMEKEGFECIFDKDQGVARQYLNLNGSEEKDRSNQFQLFTEPILI
jgi:acetyltransferase